MVRLLCVASLIAIAFVCYTNATPFGTPFGDIPMPKSPKDLVPSSIPVGSVPDMSKLPTNPGGWLQVGEKFVPNMKGPARIVMPEPAADQKE